MLSCMLIRFAVFSKRGCANRCKRIAAGLVCAAALFLGAPSSAEIPLRAEKPLATTNLLGPAKTAPKITCATFPLDSTISCVYIDWANADTRINLYEMLSEDGGISWTPRTAVTSDRGDEYDPILRYDDVNKRLWLVYAKWHEDRGGNHNDVVIRHKDCPRCNWSAATLVIGDGKHDYWVPSVLSLKNGTILAFYFKDGPESASGVGSGRIELKRSVDNGVSWSAAIKIADTCDAEYPRAIQNSFGSILLLFSRYVDSSHLPEGTNCSDGKSNGYPYSDLHQTWSSDAGKTWTGESILYHAADGSALHPFLAIENPKPQTPCATCTWDLLFIKSVDGGFGVFRAQSPDQGLHWSPPTRYSAQKWASPFNLDPGFTEGCKGAVASFSSGYGGDEVFARREDKVPACSPN
jgi:hypothetical protein